ncbi:MAG: hypothetical protein H6624_02700 [Bdellovibrionaceae bacterium]|nr:hypothetical protein [Bdellovibrionales bacterium]MCB9083221.1 hypothetical protein [Pseudobdellovibrionaceae bacterium]
MKLLNVVAFKKRDWFLILVILLLVAFGYFSEPEDEDSNDPQETTQPVSN